MGKKKDNRKKPTLVMPHSKISTTLVDVVILARDRFDLLERCVASIPDAFPGVALNIIVVDNASDEVLDAAQVKEFYAKLTQEYNNLLLVRAGKNLGFPAGCNLGVRRKSSPILFFLNSDVILDAGSGMELLMAMDNPDVGVAGMRLRFADSGDYQDANMNPAIRPAGRLQHIGLSVNVNGDIYHPFLGWEVDHPRVVSQNTTFAVTGAALMIRRNLFTLVGGFYEGYGLGTFEDVDLCMMVRDQKKDVVVVPQAQAVHYTGATLEKLQTNYPLNQNASLFRSRWMDKLMWWDFFIL
jgi:GT2 family glycosyltransferase